MPRVRKIPKNQKATKTDTVLLDEEHVLGEEKSRIQKSLLAWYRRGHRDLPWRRTTDPYSIWISEIMLQQTRVETVKDYYRRFLEKFPTANVLAQAPLEEVLGIWSGLGYYTRARNLHKAAREIASTYGGKFPSEAEQVQSLPGIGPYTAGAILSIAFGEPAPLVDGNVIRVLSRLFAIDEPVELTATQKKYWRLAKELLPLPEMGKNNPGDFNQALMELGATVCLPQSPTCLVCPVREVCQAWQRGNPNKYPPKKKERVLPFVENVVLLLMVGEELLLVRRHEVGLWGGLFEPPLIAKTGESDQDALLRLGREMLDLDLSLLLENVVSFPGFEQTLTHRHMKFSPYLLRGGGEKPRCRLSGLYTEARWVNPKNPSAIGFAVWVQKVLAQITKRKEEGSSTERRARE